MPEPESPASGARGATVAGATDGTDWRARLEGLTGARADAAVAGERPLGLQFELRRRVLRRPGQFQGARDEPARRAASVDRLGVRPVTRGSRGAWIKAGLTWQNIAYQGESGGYDPAQARWFAQFAALKGSPAGGIPTWGSELITVDEYASPLFWALLAEARRLGVHLVGADATPDVRLAAAAWVGLEATVDAEGALALVPTVDVDGAASVVEHARAVGEHGVYRFDFDAGVIELAPVAGGATSAQLALLGGADVLHVPAADLDEFLRAHHRVLARTLPIRSSDGSFAPPPAPPADLVLTATHAPAGSLRLAWAWDHGDGRTSPLAASVDPVRFDGEPAEARAAVIAAAVDVLAGFEADRDETAERVRAMLEHARDDEVELHDADAAAFADRVVPQLEGLGRVRVEVVGDPPDYRELTDRPTFTVTTVESRQADWFDLGVLVTVAGRTVPFMPLFRALSTGARRLKLVDNSYLSLRRPEFDELRELLDEAGTLAEWETGMRIHRSRASLWADFEDLADAAEPAVSWRATVAGLADDAAVESLPEPDGLALPLRPYQLDGFRWLAFLWRYRLGGILADDMGLGKTAQTLALVQHAVQARGRGAPFLVVAPTSVASNWVREAARFTPGLRVASVTATEGAGRPTITEVAADADLVVTTYAVLRLDADAFAALEWGGLVLDEAQFVKNPATKAHEAARGIRAPFRLAVTGTPVENHLGELWAILNLVAPGLFPSRRAFDERFRRPIEEDGNAERRDLLRRRIRPLMLRRTKEAVAPELPPSRSRCSPSRSPRATGACTTRPCSASGRSCSTCSTTTSTGSGSSSTGRSRCCACSRSTRRSSTNGTPACRRRSSTRCSSSSTTCSPRGTGRSCSASSRRSSAGSRAGWRPRACRTRTSTARRRPAPAMRRSGGSARVRHPSSASASRPAGSGSTSPRPTTCSCSTRGGTRRASSRPSTARTASGRTAGSWSTGSSRRARSRRRSWR